MTTLELQRLLDAMEPEAIVAMGYIPHNLPLRLAVEVAVLPEVAAAARWWREQLAGSPKQDNGDYFQSLFASMAAGEVCAPLRTDQLDAFERWLAQLFMRLYVNENWQPENPHWGSSVRCISVDYGPCRILAAACHAAGIDHQGGLRFPMKTVMWVDPGRVKVRLGYSGSEQIIFDKASGSTNSATSISRHAATKCSAFATSRIMRTCAVLALPFRLGLSGSCDFAIVNVTISQGSSGSRR